MIQRNTPISGIMTQHPACVAPEDNLEKVRAIFEKHAFHHVPVVESGILTGIVSYTDYLQTIQDIASEPQSRQNAVRILSERKVLDVMTREVWFLKLDDTLDKAVQIFQTHQFHALPVVDESKKLMGILTTNDLMRVLEVLIAPEKSFVEDYL